MAKDHRDRKAKVRVFFAEVEGDDDTIKDGLQSLATALVRAMQPPAPRLKLLPAPPPAGKDAEPSLFDQTVAPIDDAQVEDAEFEEAERLGVPAPRPKSTRPRKPPTYTVVPDLNLRPDGKQSLVDFYRVKAPADQQERVAVFLYYLSRIVAVTAVTGRHVYTCYKEVNEPVPPEILQIARNTAARKGWVDAGDPKSLRLTVTGENFVEHSLPKTKESAE